jgi:hypothetical protein
MLQKYVLNVGKKSPLKSSHGKAEYLENVIKSVDVVCPYDLLNDTMPTENGK